MRFVVALRAAVRAAFYRPTRSGLSEACHGCGVETDMDLLDGKDGGTGDFTILHCRRCYGPGWLPTATEPRFRIPFTCGATT